MVNNLKRAAAPAALMFAVLAGESVQAQEVTAKVSGRVMMDWSIVDAENADMD